MLLKGLGSLALAAVTAFAPLASADSVQASFVEPNRRLAFAISVPENATDELYFTLSVDRAMSWGGVGLGTADMPGALFLILYEARDGHSVTFSPRLADGHFEPKYFEDFEYETLPGTIADKNWMTIVAKCTKHCRTWPGSGEGIDVESTDQNAIYAIGPLEGFTSNDPREGLKFHEDYGSFKIDLASTQGATEPPSLAVHKDENTELEYQYNGQHDWLSIMHAVFMILCIVGLMPFGVVILRFGGWVRWHRINQSVALIGVLIGFGLGVAVSFRYQRSRGFNDYHQILGFIVVIFILGQFCLGFLHHNRYKRTQMPTKYGKSHVWVGRGILLVGIMNGFFGLTFALNRRYGLVLAGLIIFVCFASVFVIFGRRWLNRRELSSNNSRAVRQYAIYNRPPPPPNHISRGPYRVSSSLPDEEEYLADPPPRYEPPRHGLPQVQHIGLQNAAEWRRSTEPKDESVQQVSAGHTTPREFA